MRKSLKHFKEVRFSIEFNAEEESVIVGSAFSSQIMKSENEEEEKLAFQSKYDTPTNIEFDSKQAESHINRRKIPLWELTPSCGICLERIFNTKDYDRMQPRVP